MLPTVAFPVTPSVVPIVALAFTVNALTAAFPVALNVLTIAVFPPALPKVPLTGPLNDTAAVNEFADIMLAPVIFPPDPVPSVILDATLNVVPTVADPLTVNPAPVILPVALTVVNWPVLAVALPIGVLCSPPAALNVVPAVIEPFAVNAAPVIFPVALTVVN